MDAAEMILSSIEKLFEDWLSDQLSRFNASKHQQLVMEVASPS